MRILYVKENDDLLLPALRAGGIVVDHCEGVDDPLDYLRSLEFDCILLCESTLDLALHTVIRQIREAGFATPILVFCDDGCGDTGHAAAALNAGADDYMLHPLPTEMMSRVRALVRRANGQTRPTVEIGPFVLDLSSKTVRHNDDNVHLTGKEYVMFELLAMRRGRVIPKEGFLGHMYLNPDEEPDAKIIDVFICKLRKKLCAFEGGDVVKTIWGRGYTIDLPAVSRTERNSATEEHHAQA